MKKAKSIATKRQISVKADHLGLAIDHRETINSMPDVSKRAYSLMRGSILDLINVHNAVLDTSQALTSDAVVVLKRTCAALEFEIDQKIEAMNAFLDHEIPAKSKPVSPKRSRAMRKAWRARKKQSKKGTKK